MKAEFYKVRGTELEEMVKRGNSNEISSMISQKRQALADALENVDFYKSIGNMEFASNEQNRANLLQRQLEMLNK
mgnify:CR=1 FL=1|nr:MAG TPA: hypothetical protein [Herelleviridae sp.]